MPNKIAKTIEDALFDQGLITSDQLSAIKFEQVQTGKSPTQIIKERGYISEKDFVKAFGSVYGIEYVDLAERKIEQSLLDIIPLATAKKYKVIAFEFIGGALSVAMADPLNLQTIDFIERKTGHKVIPFITVPRDIDTILDDQKGKAIGEEITAAMEEINQTTLKVEEGLGDIKEATLRDAPIARIVGMILETAVKTGASDVHIEPGEKDTRIRYRIDGVLVERRTIPKEMHDSVIARIKILGKMKIDEKRIPLDGRFRIEVGNSRTDLRISTLPSIYGEKVVIRLLKEEGKIYSFKDLGLRGAALTRLEDALAKPTGMILVTGPTGSGKTVTLASALSKLNTVKVNIITIEDPVEIRVDGVTQVQVNTQAGLTFAMGLRSFLRQDPDIIMVGEIRDEETAELATHAALTGHLVLSTLHTNSSAGALPRFLDMGIENFLLASTLNSVVAQRLTRKICDFCKEEYEPPEEVMKTIKSVVKGISKKAIMEARDPSILNSIKKAEDEHFKISRGKGCDKCGNSGYHGRLGIFEVLPVNEEIARAVMESATSDQISKIGEDNGMITLIQDGFLRVLEGLTTLEEIMRVAD